MYSTILILVLAPPVLAFVLWQVLRYGPKVGFPSIPFRLGKNGYWKMLTLSYVAMFAAALVSHRI
jgi:hypothetical protein